MDRSHMSTDNEEVSSSSAMPDSAKSGSKTYAFKPGRKFGLTGQRQNHQQQVFVNSFTSGGSTADGRRMSVREEQRNSWMYSLSEQEMEDKYNAICLAIRTENLTLGQRLEHQHAERDLVENNLSQEVRVLHSLFVTVKQEVARTSQASPYRDGLSSGAWNEIFIKVANQLDAVHSSATRISSSAESLGAVEYEARLSAAVQVLILYVDHIKRKWEKEHHELEETKRILKESGVNVAQCLANLPDRLGAGANAQPSGPVSKRRASFPAAPFRRISLKPPPLVIGNARLSATLSDPSAKNDCVSATVPIAEEREDATESDHPPLSASSIKTGDQQEAGKTAPTPSQSPAHLPSTQSAPTPPASTANSANVPSAPGVSVTIRRRGVGGLKSHSWSSGHTTSGLLDRRESAESSGRLAGAGAKTSWFSKAGQWTRLQLKQWRKTAATYTSSYAQQWTSLRQKRLQLLRYSASACFLLAALVSIVVTFVPSSGSPSPYNATVMPGHRTAR
ncbi:hypothetical protein GHT06_018003 [Daphnia sinensis]|uniref:Lymphoid-restricted membrane protein n=1 Tax=Daphnia sinensis TaxID=1820382 RepID=A0AAD5L4D8_9CRUS|nr:hypothetical protein GHT06_018003 [Daphnia sinensis]